uniref:PLAC domain-containing protein n=1 Tax=Chelonoidis abingdonii TaxID=106734 RepID=A0A8C0IQM6_CHEAB
MGWKNSTARLWNELVAGWPEGLRKGPANTNLLESTKVEAYTSRWSECSRTCGEGYQYRTVKCYQGDALGHGCDPAFKPDAKQTCQLQVCPMEASEDCEDKTTANCVLVLKVKLCSHWYYRKACCRSCRSKAS